MIAKRQNAAIMALLVFFFSVFPAKRSEALVPLAIGLTLRVLASGGAVGGVDLLTAGVTNFIGGSILALGLYPSSISDNTPVLPVRFPTTAGDTSAYLPTNSTPDVDTAFVGNAPASGTTDDVTYSGWEGSGLIWPTMAAAATQGRYISFPSLAVIEAALPLGETTAYNCWVTNPTSGTGKCSSMIRNNPDETTYLGETTYYYSGDNRCPAGYSVDLNGTSGCALTDPTAASQDFLSDFRRNGQQYTFTDADTLPSYANNKNGNLGVYGQDSQGRPVYVEVRPTAAGGAEIGVYTQVGTEVQAQTISVAGNGQVTSANTQTATGSVSAPTAVNTPAVVSGVQTVANSTTGTDSGSIVFPTDYARAGEAAQAANTVKTSVDQLKDKFNNTETVNDPTVPDWADHWGATFNPLKAWSMPGHSSVCPTSGFEWNGATYTISSHCQLITDHWSGLQSASVVVWTLFAIWILLGA